MARRVTAVRPEVPAGDRVVAFYIRVSSDKQAKSGMGLEAQLAGIERDWYARRESSPDKDRPVRVYRDEGAPGWMGWDTRPVSGELYRDAAAGRVARVIVFAPDRASRDTKDSLDMLDKFSDLDVVVEFVTLPNLTNSPAHRMALIQAFSVAEFEGRTIGARSIASKRVRWANGKLAIKPQFGYRRDGDAFVIDPAQAEAIRRMAAMFLEGVTVREIARRLNADKVPTVKGGPWTRATVRYMLANPVYTGTLVVNRRQVLKKSTGEGRRGQTVVRYRWREVPEGERYTLSVPVILDAATHRAILSRLADSASAFHANNRKGAHHVGAPGRADGPFALLRGGILFCLECERAGAPEVPVYASTRGGRSPRYRCSSRDRHNGGGPCGASWDLAHVDRVTREAFADHIAKDAETHLLIEARTHRGDDKATVLTLTRKADGIKAKRDRVLDMFAEGVITRAERDTRLRPYVADLAETEQAIAAASVPVVDLDAVRGWATEVRAALLEDASAPHVATMIRTVCRRVRIGRDVILLDIVPDRLIPHPVADTTGCGTRRVRAVECPKGEKPSTRQTTFRTEVTPRPSSTPALAGAASRVITIPVSLPPVVAPVVPESRSCAVCHATFTAGGSPTRRRVTCSRECNNALKARTYRASVSSTQRIANARAAGKSPRRT
jgi:DNA invertase Pin-like site-specific DNA recombinase